jgi:hypothetical protein
MIANAGILARPSRAVKEKLALLERSRSRCEGQESGVGLE